MYFTIEYLPPWSRFNHQLQGAGGAEREEKKKKGNIHSTQMVTRNLCLFCFLFVETGI